MSRRPGPSKTLAQEIVDGIDEFTAAVASGRPLATKFNCRTVTVDFGSPEYDGELVKKTRAVLGASQTIFAQLLGVSPKTVRAWEQDVNLPHEASCRLMDEVRRDPAYWRKRLSDAIVVKR
jgi:DNA-binding transcriptional regulator YiaG